VTEGGEEDGDLSLDLSTRSDTLDRRRLFPEANCVGSGVSASQSMSAPLTSLVSLFEGDVSELLSLWDSSRF